MTRTAKHRTLFAPRVLGAARPAWLPLWLLVTFGGPGLARAQAGAGESDAAAVAPDPAQAPPASEATVPPATAEPGPPSAAPAATPAPSSEAEATASVQAAAEEAMQQQMFEAAMRAAPVSAAPAPAVNSAPAPDPVTPAPAPEPALDKQGCPKNWGCWELIYSTRGAVLGVRATGSYVHQGQTNDKQVGFAVTYFAEHFATRETLSLHVNALGAIGGGSAGTEGAVGGEIDLGYRGKTGEHAGPFLRAGPSGVLQAHPRVHFGELEPLRLRAGYQLLDGDFALETGVTQGYVVVGSFSTLGSAQRDLAGANEMGGYGVLRTETFRVRASLMHLAPRGGAPVEAASLLYCDYHIVPTLCGDVQYFTSRVGVKGSDERTHALLFGFTVGFSP